MHVHEADIILLETRKLLRACSLALFLIEREEKSSVTVFVNLDKLFWLLKKEIAAKCLKREIMSLALSSLASLCV